MRSDMYKVIVERPRKGKEPGAKADRLRHDFEGPGFLGMRAGLGYRALNENLSPLKRYLRKQVGRPWNKVHSEISAGIDRRNTVQQHIFRHLDDMIAVQVAWRNGRWIDLKNRTTGYFWGTDEISQELYVDPRTGLIHRNKQFRSYSTQRRAHREAQADAIAQRRRRLDANTLLLRLKSEWYEVRIAPMPPPREIAFNRGGTVHHRVVVQKVYDAVLRRKVGRPADGIDPQRELFGDYYTYAVSKRQLSKREISTHGLPRQIV